jgi:hypothetical protein
LPNPVKGKCKSKGKGKGKIAPVLFLIAHEAMTAYWGSIIIAPRIL